MGGVFERPAFWLLVLVVLVVAVVALVVVLATKGSRKAAVPASAPVGLPGWYPQPDGTKRYWDGRGWADSPPA